MGHTNLYAVPGDARPCATPPAVLGLLCALLGAEVRADPAGPAAAPPLDLRPGDLRRFVPAADLHAPWTTDLDEVVIRPRREPPDLPERRAVPGGLGGLWWAAGRPTQAWRLFVPDPNADPDAPATRPRSPADPQPPPGSWRLRLDQSGKVW